MNKDMKVKAWWLMRVGLLLAVVLAGSAGCERPAECDKLDVVCADELSREIINDSGQYLYMSLVKFRVPPNSKAKYKTSYRCLPAADVSEYFQYDTFTLAAVANYMEPDPSTRCTITISDADVALGRSQSVELCLNEKAIPIDCSNFVMPEKKAKKLNKDNAAQLAVRVSCSKLTYKETKTKKTIGTGEDLWGDMTWVVKTSENYDMGAAPKVTGFRYTEPTGSFMSGKTDVNDMLGTSDFKPVTQLYGATGAELRLPLRFGYENLVDALKDDKKVLHAGWLAAFETVGEDKVVKKEWVNIGCSIKQTKLASILDSALNGKPIGGQTVHILFSDQAPKGQLVGENGWCYGLTTGGATPLFKPHSSTETGKLCNF